MGDRTSKLNLYKPAYGEAGADWWDEINANFDILDDAMLNTADPAPDDDHSVEGRVHTGTAGEALAFGQAVYLKSDGKYWKTDASAEATAKGMLRIVASESIGADASGLFALPGTYIRDDTWAWTVGAPLFLDEATAGGLTETAPSDTGDIVRVAGYARSADIVFFDPSKTWVEVS